MNLCRILSKVSMGALIFSIFLVNGCQSEDILVQWTENQITADGQLDDWENIPLELFEDEQVTLGLCNDSTNLYILFRFNNIEWARIIRMSGLTLWVHPDGKKDTEFGIRYRGGPTMEELQKLQNPDRQDSQREISPEMRERMNGRMNADAPTFAIVDNKAEQIVAIAEDGSSGPSVGYASAEGFFAYEFVVPLEIINADFYGIEMTPGQAVALGVQWGGKGDMKRPEGMSMRRGMGGDGRGGGMPPGGGGGSRGGDPGGMRRPEMPKEQKIWIKTNLAKGENGGKG